MQRAEATCICDCQMSRWALHVTVQFRLSPGMRAKFWHVPEVQCHIMIEASWCIIPGGLADAKLSLGWFFFFFFFFQTREGGILRRIAQSFTLWSDSLRLPVENLAAGLDPSLRSFSTAPKFYLREGGCITGYSLGRKILLQVIPWGRKLYQILLPGGEDIGSRVTSWDRRLYHLLYFGWGNCITSYSLGEAAVSQIIPWGRRLYHRLVPEEESLLQDIPMGDYCLVYYSMSEETVSHVISWRRTSWWQRWKLNDNWSRVFCCHHPVTSVRLCHFTSHLKKKANNMWIEYDNWNMS